MSGGGRAGVAMKPESLVVKPEVVLHLHTAVMYPLRPSQVPLVDNPALATISKGNITAKHPLFPSLEKQVFAWSWEQLSI